MTDKPTVLHILDDTTAGGVTRVVDFLVESGALAQNAIHKKHVVRRGRFGSVPCHVDMIVSHTVISWRTLPSLIALRAARPSIPIVHVEHSYTEGFVDHNVKVKARFGTLLKVAFSLFDRVVAVSHGQADWIKTHNLCHDDRLLTIQSHVDLSPFKAIAAPVGPIRTLGAVGRLEPQKGFDLLIAAFKKLPDEDLRLHIYGQGSQKDALRSLAGEDTRITFFGHTETPTEAYERVDAVVMPSRWEAFGLVAIEAIAAKRPLLCSHVDGLKDHGPIGAEFVRGNSTESLVQALRRFVSISASSVTEDNMARLLEMEQQVNMHWRNLIDLTLSHGCSYDRTPDLSLPIV